MLHIKSMKHFMTKHIKLVRNVCRVLLLNTIYSTNHCYSVV